MSPILYILITLLFSSLTLSIIFFTAWAAMGRQKHTLVWGVTFIAASLQWLVNIFSSYLGFPIYWMSACILSVLTITLGTWGHALRTQACFKASYMVVSSVIVVLLTYYFSFVNAHKGLSMSLYIYHTVFFLVVCAVMIYNYRKKSTAAELGAVVVYVILAVAQFAAATTALMQGSERDSQFIDIYRLINFTTLPSAYIGMGMFVVFMLASDLAEKMRLQATTDSLTGCLNRRGFYQQAQRRLAKFKAKAQHVCLIYWDIDKFKSINDNYGHAAGDLVLQKTVEVIKQSIKENDLIGRLGGEEFVILLGRAELDEAQKVAERLRQVIEENIIVFENQIILVTASFGVVDIQNPDVLVEKAIDSADQALYQAKQSGRNQVVKALTV